MPVKTVKRLGMLALAIVLALPTVAVLASEPEQFFASIFYDKAKNLACGGRGERLPRLDDEIDAMRPANRPCVPWYRAR